MSWRRPPHRLVFLVRKLSQNPLLLPLSFEINRFTKRYRASLYSMADIICLYIRCQCYRSCRHQLPIPHAITH